MRIETVSWIEAGDGRVWRAFGVRGLRLEFDQVDQHDGLVLGKRLGGPGEVDEFDFDETHGCGKRGTDYCSG